MLTLRTHGRPAPRADHVSRALRVAVLGARGIIASAIVRDLAESDEAAELPPERSVEPDDLFPELERRNCRFRVEEGVAG